MPDYEDKAFANASKEDLMMADKDEEEKKKDKVSGGRSKRKKRVGNVGC